MIVCAIFLSYQYRKATTKAILTMFSPSTWVTMKEQMQLLRAARHDRLQKRDAEKGRQEVASGLLDLSENVPPPEKGLHDQCIKTIASLCIENEHLYTELGRLQTENAQLNEEINKLSKLSRPTVKHSSILVFLLGHFFVVSNILFNYTSNL